MTIQTNCLSPVKRLVNIQASDALFVKRAHEKIAVAFE